MFILDLSVYLLSYLKAETITAKRGSLPFMQGSHRGACALGCGAAREAAEPRPANPAGNVFNIMELMRL